MPGWLPKDFLSFRVSNVSGISLTPSVLEIPPMRPVNASIVENLLHRFVSGLASKERSAVLKELQSLGMGCIPIVERWMSKWSLRTGDREDLQEVMLAIQTTVVLVRASPGDCVKWLEL